MSKKKLDHISIHGADVEGAEPKSHVGIVHHFTDKTESKPVYYPKDSRGVTDHVSAALDGQFDDPDEPESAEANEPAEAEEDYRTYKARRAKESAKARR